MQKDKIYLGLMIISDFILMSVNLIVYNILYVCFYRQIP